MRILILFLNLSFVILPNVVLAGGHIAVLQFSNPYGWTQLVYQLNVKNRSVCEKLNDSHWKGVKTNCKECKIDFKDCVGSVPQSHSGIVHNKSILYPYLSSMQDRIIYFGMPIEAANNFCLEMENAYKNILNRDAKCILP